MQFIDESGFLTTFGREFCAVLNALPSFTDALQADEASGHDCYSVFVDTLGFSPSPEAIASLDGGQVDKLATGFNEYFEVSVVTPKAIQEACAAVLRHWLP